MHALTHAHTSFTRICDEIFHETNVLGAKKEQEKSCLLLNS